MAEIEPTPKISEPGDIESASEAARRFVDGNEAPLIRESLGDRLRASKAREARAMAEAERLRLDRGLSLRPDEVNPVGQLGPALVGATHAGPRPVKDNTPEGVTRIKAGEANPTGPLNPEVAQTKAEIEAARAEAEQLRLDRGLSLRPDEVVPRGELSPRLKGDIEATHNKPEPTPTPGRTVIRAGEVDGTGELSDNLKAGIGSAKGLPPRVVIRGQTGSLLGTFDEPQPFPVKETQAAPTIEYDESTAGTLSPLLAAQVGRAKFPKEVPVAVDRRNDASKDLTADPSWRDESPEKTVVNGYTTTVRDVSTKMDKHQDQVLNEQQRAAKKAADDARWSEEVRSMTE